MKKITLKKGKTAEDAVFEKTGISMEFTIETVDSFMTELEEQKMEVENKLLLVNGAMDKMEAPDLSRLKSKQYSDFSVYARYMNQVKLALQEIKELEENNGTFASIYSDLDNQFEAPKYISLIEEKKSLEGQYVALEDTIKDYRMDRDTALSCLE